MKPAALIMVLLLAATAGAEEGKLTISLSPMSTSERAIFDIKAESSRDLEALDIPLGFSEGITLEKVEFAKDVERFAFTGAWIEQENRRVYIGLVSLGPQPEIPDFPAGSATVAQMYFKVEPGVSQIVIKTVVTTMPDRSLCFYYNDFTPGYPVVKTIEPEFVFEGMGSLIPLDAESTNPGAIPDVYALSQNSPNPFNPVTGISYALPEGGDVKMVVFNILGQNVRTLVDGFMPAGYHEVVWDGTDQEGRSIASGIYFYRLITKGLTDTRKMLLLK